MTNNKSRSAWPLLFQSRIIVVILMAFWVVVVLLLLFSVIRSCDSWLQLLWLFLFWFFTLFSCLLWSRLWAAGEQATKDDEFAADSSCADGKQQPHTLHPRHAVRFISGPQPLERVVIQFYYTINRWLLRFVSRRPHQTTY